MNEALAAVLAAVFLVGVTAFVISIAAVSRGVHETRNPAPPVPGRRPNGGDPEKYGERS